jgi:hypothetical protein
MLFEGKVGKLNYWLPQDNEIGGNVHFQYPLSNEIRTKIHERCGIVNALEPDYDTGGKIITIDTPEIARMINYEYTEEGKFKCVKCNGILASLDFLKENHFGLYGRSSDCLMVAIVSDTWAMMLHVSAEALNNGILLGLPLDCKGSKAVMGPCISKENYALSSKLVPERTGNYGALGYKKFCEERQEGDETKLHIDIRGITKDTLEKKGVEIVFSDERCTFATPELGSHRRPEEFSRANALYIW